jgi:hypothetical protein|tara:strand:- start:255 stop:554 length:300 start_codon:yes stop_codon:yes gene_type:complete
VWETTFNNTFFLTLAGILLFGFGGLMRVSRAGSCVRDVAPPPPPPPKEDPASENEEPRFTRREVGDMIQRAMSQRPSSKYHYINGMYIKIKVNGPSSLQ